MINLFLLQSGVGSAGSINMLFLILMFAVMYFFFIRPQQKRNSDQTKFEKGIQKGDEIVTTSGIIGKINKMDANSVQLQLDQKTFINVLPSAISKELTESYSKKKIGSE